MSFLLIQLLGCQLGGPETAGWKAREATDGPTVLYDLAALPLPEIPLPNDQATRLDPDSPTGRRLNISLLAPTKYEQQTRASFNQMDGFGTYAPIMVSFDEALDVGDLKSRHGENADFRDDAVFLLNVDPDCERYGEEIAMDVGGGRYPVSMYRYAAGNEDPEAPDGHRFDGKGPLFEFDLRAGHHNMLFEERNEDKNQNGTLDPGEDWDGDGVLDVANFIDTDACEGEIRGSISEAQCVADNLMTFYDRQSETLILRPIWPLEQQCTHAVLLTKRLVGENGSPIQSPFPYVNVESQTQDIQRAEPFLTRYGLSVDDIAFGWTFTTGTMTKDLEALRAGLHGHGVFSRLSTEFPVSGLHIWTRADLAGFGNFEAEEGREEERMMDGACVGTSLTWLWGPNALDEWPANMCSLEADLTSLGGLFGGKFKAPNLMIDRDGAATELYPADNDEQWELNHMTGEAIYGEGEVTFWCAVPQERDNSCSPGNPEGKPFCKPFPTILYAHGYGGSKAEISLHLGRHASMGYAMCSLDGYGHGLNRWMEDPSAGAAMTLAGVEFARNEVRPLGTLMLKGRDRDLNNDGYSDPGADMWTSDVFHTRDMVRQSVLEYMQFVRILRGADGENKDDAGHLLGDIDKDGIVDIGGPKNTVSVWGISLGGIVAGVLAGSEPGLNASSPNAGGAGLADIAVRARQAGVPQAVLMPIMGQLVAGCIPVDGHQNPIAVGEPTGNNCMPDVAGGDYEGGDLRLAFFVNDTAKKRTKEFALVKGVMPGDRIRIENLNNGETVEGKINKWGWVRLGIASDALGPIERRPIIGLTDDDIGPVYVPDPTEVADALVITVFKQDSDEPRAVVDTFQQEVNFQGSTYSPGVTLVALQEGLGLPRNSPEFRRFLAIAQNALSPADPAIWTSRALVDPINVDYDENAETGQTRVLVMPTAGDTSVPVNTGIAMGRVGGLFGSWLRDDTQYSAENGWREIFTPDPRFGRTIDEEMIKTHVVEGDAGLQRYAGHDLNPNVLYDIDDIADGTAQFTCSDEDWSAVIGENRCPDDIADQDIDFDVPNPEQGNALRVNRLHEDGLSYDAFRVPLLRPAGQHGIYNSQPFRTFDTDAYMVNFTVRFLGSRGEKVEHETGCDCSATGLPEFFRNGEELNPGIGEACGEEDLKLCDESCAEAWGFISATPAECNTD